MGEKPEYAKCISISTDASLREMVLPGLLVILSPIVTGVLFGTAAVYGLLIGALISGVQLAISQSNTGGAWDNAKKYVEQGKVVLESWGEDEAGWLVHVDAGYGSTKGVFPIEEEAWKKGEIKEIQNAFEWDLKQRREHKCWVHGKNSEVHKAAVTGDTVGDPLKDTSGPALNIVMKLTAIISLVFADFFMMINDGHGVFNIRAANIVVLCDEVTGKNCLMRD